MDFELLRGECLLENLSDKGLADRLRKLNRLFVSERDRMAGYVDDPELVSAYAAFYMPTNILKLEFMLGAQGGALPEADSDVEVVDYGCGPGTYSFGLHAGGEGASDWRYHLVDKSPTMLEQARRIRDRMFPGMKATFHRRVPKLPSGAFKVLILGNVVNEIPDGEVEALTRRLEPDAMIAIEPGTPESFERMSRVRRFMIRKRYACLYPCPDERKCPAATREGEWCHQVLRGSLDPALERLGQLAGLDRKVMPFIGHVYSRGEHPGGSVAQLYRLRKNSKHAFHWWLCAPKGSLRLVEVEVPKRGMSRDEVKALEVACAGQFVRVEWKAELGNGAWRIGATLI